MIKKRIRINNKKKVKSIKPDAYIRFADINHEFYRQLCLIGPFGIMNPAPIFWTRKCKIIDIYNLNGGHLKMTLDDGSSSIIAVKWNETAKKILAKINGLNPNPGAWFEYKNQRYKVWKAKIVNQNGNVGKTLDDKLTIACKDKAISILEIQKEGKGKQEIEKFLLGNKIKEGESIS